MHGSIRAPAAVATTASVAQETFRDIQDPPKTHSPLQGDVDFPSHIYYDVTASHQGRLSDRDGLGFQLGHRSKARRRRLTSFFVFCRRTEAPTKQYERMRQITSGFSSC